MPGGQLRGGEKECLDRGKVDRPRWSGCSGQGEVHRWGGVDRVRWTGRSGALNPWTVKIGAPVPGEASSAQTRTAAQPLTMLTLEPFNLKPLDPWNPRALEPADTIQNLGR